MKRLLALFAVIALAAGGCGGDDDKGTPAGKSTGTETTQSQSGGVDTSGAGDEQTTTDDEGSDVADQGY
jgi:hypothetical protein